MISGRIEAIVPVSGERVRVAGDTMRLSSLSKMTALDETRTTTWALESCGGVRAGVGRLAGRLRAIPRYLEEKSGQPC